MTRAVAVNRRVGLLVGGFALVVVVLLSGCGKAAEKVSEKAAETASGGEADVDIKGDKVDIKTKDGTVSYGEEVPSGWPEDIPFPDGFKATGGSEITEGDDTVMVAAGSTEKSLDALKSFYKDKFSDWQEMMATTMGSDQPLFNVVYQLDDRLQQIGMTDTGDVRELTFTYTKGPVN